MDNVLFLGVTDMGQIRTNNEDAFISQHIWDDNHILAVAIDGVGGYEGGEVAAALAQKNIVEYLINYPNGERVELLKQAVIYANNSIVEEREKNSEYGNMSCVLTAIIVEVKERRISMAHVGDTRLYQYQYGDIIKLSHDHSLVGYREEIGDLTEDEAMKHPQRNVIGRDVGSEILEDSDKKYVEVATFPLLANSILLLCSDGLCDMISSSHMASILSQKQTIDEKAAALIAAANEAGGKDNVTVVLVEANFEENAIASEVEDKSEVIIANKENDPLKTKENIKIDNNSRSKPNWKRLILLIISYLIVLLLGCYIGYINIKPEPAALTEQKNINEIQSDSTSTYKRIKTEVVDSLNVESSPSSEGVNKNNAEHNEEEMLNNTIAEKEIMIKLQDEEIIKLRNTVENQKRLIKTLEEDLGI